jgi:hypothetical protein
VETLEEPEAALPDDLPVLPSIEEVQVAQHLELPWLYTQGTWQGPPRRLKGLDPIRVFLLDVEGQEQGFAFDAVNQTDLTAALKSLQPGDSVRVLYDVELGVRNALAVERVGPPL